MLRGWCYCKRPPTAIEVSFWIGAVGGGCHSPECSHVTTVDGAVLTEARHDKGAKHAELFRRSRGCWRLEALTFVEQLACIPSAHDQLQGTDGYNWLICFQVTSFVRFDRM